VAGNERRGFAASSADLFAGRSWILTPEGAEARALRTVRALVRQVGARPVSMDAAEHDRALAFLSHLPQVVAWALRDAADHDPVAGRRLRLAGPGFRDMTRLARSPRPLWREILGANRDELARALRAFAARLTGPSSRGR
jgi:prephenate dehydrogenase